MFTNFLKLILIMLAAQFAFTAPAHACRGGSFETQIFWESMPEYSPRENTFVGKIELEPPSNPNAVYDLTVPILAVVKQSPSHPELTGQTINVQPPVVTSCGPHLIFGEERFVRAKIALATARPILVLETNRYVDLVNAEIQK